MATPQYFLTLSHSSSEYPNGSLLATAGFNVSHAIVWIRVSVRFCLCLVGEWWCPTCDCCFSFTLWLLYSTIEIIVISCIIILYYPPKSTHFWLVVSNMNFIFHSIWDFILPIDELIFFKMVKTTNQQLYYSHYPLVNIQKTMERSTIL